MNPERRNRPAMQGVNMARFGAADNFLQVFFYGRVPVQPAGATQSSIFFKPIRRAGFWRADRIADRIGLPAGGI
jgi:hypothetical protein